MLDFLYTPIPMWLFFVLTILTMWELRKYHKKPVGSKVKKKKIIDRLNEKVFVFPKQEEIDLSQYGSEMEDWLKSFNTKNSKVKTRATLDPWEVSAKIIDDFRYYQQYLNVKLPHGFVVERDGLSTKYKIFCGRIKVADVEVTTDVLTEDIHGMVGNRPSVCISAELHFTELLNYVPTKRLLGALADTHMEEGSDVSNLLLNLQVEKCISEHLWKLQQRSTLNQYTNENIEYEESITVEFRGTYSDYRRYINIVGTEKIYLLEKNRIENMETEYGYKRVEKD